MTIDLRTAPRYFVSNGMPATIEGLEGVAIDLSVRGARLQSTRPLPVGKIVSLVLHTAQGPLTTKATVLWSQIAAVALHDDEDDRHLCGVSFEPVPMLDHVIDELLSRQEAILISDARGAERYRVLSAITATFGNIGSVRVLDISERGARIGATSMLRVGSRAPLRFRIHGYETAVTVEAMVVWSRPAEKKGRFESGLCIHGDEQWLRAVIDELSLRNEVQVDLNSIRRKFASFQSTPGLMALI
jgi:hypothetical protein